jgi:HD-GYP domain-containing protein (c-di-GMP phosphodiesterase class II)
VALADVFDALTHVRPYKQAWPTEKALAEVRRLVGTHFDPAVVDAFFKLDTATLVELPLTRPRTRRRRTRACP